MAHHYPQCIRRRIREVFQERYCTMGIYWAAIRHRRAVAWTFMGAMILFALGIPGVLFGMIALAVIWAIDGVITELSMLRAGEVIAAEGIRIHRQDLIDQCRDML